MKLKNKFIIVIPCFNTEEYIEQCIASVLSQKFDDLGIIIRDDVSTDKTPELIKEYFGVSEFNQQFKFEDKDIIIIRNTEKLYAGGNTFESVIDYVDNPEAIIGVVDGDDTLLKRTSVQTIFDAYDDNTWIVWSQHLTTSDKIGLSKELPDDKIVLGARAYWSISHFRTSKAFLFSKINKDDLLDPETGKYMLAAGDASLLYPFVEMAGYDRCKFINTELYLYRDDIPTNDHTANRDTAIRLATHLKKNGRRYQLWKR